MDGDVRRYIRESSDRLVAETLHEHPSLLKGVDEDERTLLMCALSESRSLHTVRTILEADAAAAAAGSGHQTILDINAKDAAGYTALHIAASLGAPFVELLLPLKPEIDSRSNAGQTPLFLAVSRQHADVVRILLEHGASPKTKDKRQVTPLQRAAAVGSLVIVGMLLDAGAPVNATDAQGWTALHYAYAEGHSGVISTLEERGANTDAESRDGERPNDVASGL